MITAHLMNLLSWLYINLLSWLLITKHVTGAALLQVLESSRLLINFLSWLLIRHTTDSALSPVMKPKLRVQSTYTGKNTIELQPTKNTYRKD